MFRLSRNFFVLLFVSAMILGNLVTSDAMAVVQIDSGDTSTSSSRRAVQQPAENSGQPNIILINLDDADIDLFSQPILDEYLPNIKQLAADGLVLTNCHVVTPLCGPSRTCLLRGQYADRTGIKTNLAEGPMNNGFSGDYHLFKKLGYEQQHLGVWMHNAGYRTMMIGKYLHGRMDPEGIPGWDDMHICFGGNYYSTSRYSTRFPVDQRRQSTGDTEYRTVVEADQAVWMIEQQVARNGHADAAHPPQPFFLYLAPLAPHKPTVDSDMLQREYEDLGQDLRIPETPDLNESDVSDKPTHLQVVKLDEEEMAMLNDEFRKRVIATKSVDDLVGRLRETLRENGLADHTYIFFTSDHGYQLGHNRMIAKKVPFHRNTVVPMFVVGPGIQPGTADHLLAQIDLVPTFLELAGGTAPVTLDGKSWVPILNDPAGVDSDAFREALLIQNWEEKGQLGNWIPATYASLRLPHQIYTEWSNGQTEYYNLTTDPYQVENQIGTLSDEQQSDLSRHLHQLKQAVDQPIVTFNCPELISKNTLLSGMAEDDDAVETVQVSIHDPHRDVYWNGLLWGSAESFVDATLLRPHGLISDWKCSVDLSEIENEGEIRVVAKARDRNGNLSLPVESVFRVDAIEPETILKLPAAGSTVSSPITLFGTCSDNQDMQGIELVLQNVDDDTYWNGAEWVKESSTFFKRVNQERWHTTLDAPVGNYRASATALDQAGNRDATPALTEFSVK